MAYNPYVIGNPDGTTGTGATFATQLQTNLNALMDAIIMGEMASWNMAVTVGTGTASYPQIILYTNGVYQVKLTMTYDVNNNVSTIVFAKSVNSGGTFDTIKTVTYAYDGSSNVTGYTWS
jgi:hypothetical protein